MRIGPHVIEPPVVLAPMAGVTDKPFRLLCKRMGAGLAVSEMTTADPRLWHTAKSRKRMDHDGEPDPVAVQIAGYDPHMLAEAARFNVEHGAQIIDINMGCPAKKVCNVWSGSALLQDEPLVARICRAVVEAVEVPVTLKIRTGWNRQNRNALNIARIAEDCGVAALSVHGLERGKRRQAMLSLAVTLALGATFLVLKGVEYAHHLEDGMAPGGRTAFFRAQGVTGLESFVTLYYVSTGLHALHVVVGMTILAVFFVLVATRRVGRPHAHKLETAVLYWHLVDAIWIFLWPMYYLTGGKG